MITLKKYILFFSVTLLLNNNDYNVPQTNYHDAKYDSNPTFFVLGTLSTCSIPCKAPQIVYEIRGKIVLNSPPWNLEGKG